MTSLTLFVLSSFALCGTIECSPECDANNLVDEIVTLQNVNAAVQNINAGTQISVYDDDPELEPDRNPVHGHIHDVSTLVDTASLLSLSMLEEEAVNSTDEVADRVATYPLLDWVTFGNAKQTATDLTNAALARLPLGNSLSALSNISFLSWSRATSLLGTNASLSGAAAHRIDVLSPQLMFPILIPLMVVICGVTTACVSLSFPSESDPVLLRESCSGGFPAAGYDDELSQPRSLSERSPRRSSRRGSQPQTAPRDPMAAIHHSQQCKLTLCGPQPIMARAQCMMQSIHGPKTSIVAEPIATLLYMEQGTVNRAPWDTLTLAGKETEDTNGMPSSRIVLKHGGATVACLDTTFACMDPGRKACDLYLADDSGVLKRPGFATMRPSGQDGRFLVSTVESSQVLLTADVTRVDGKQSVALADPEGHVVAYLESQQGPTTKDPLVTYNGSFNSVVVDCSLVLLSWAAALKLADPA